MAAAPSSLSLRDTDRFSVGKRQFWREFLALYQRMPELWDTHHYNYRNKELKHKAYDLLEAKLREIQPNATRNDVGRRINIFRTNYRREQLRLVKQRDLGLHADLCKPTLWFYDNMSFLLTQESFQQRNKRSRSNQNTNSDSNRRRPRQQPELASTQSEESSLLSPKIEIFDQNVEKFEEPMDINDKPPPSDDLKDLPATQTVLRADSPAKNGTDTTLLSESSLVLAKSWALQYDEMAPIQRILARKAIADILFEGCMGNLRINRGESSSSVGNR